MATKYLIHGATYCGDGTALNEAASAGAAGAWNNINVYSGSAPAYGSLAAGDVVNIRSKTSAGNDIVVTLSASATLGSSAATSTNWVTWALDGGTVWSGINGTLTFECPSTYTITLRSYNYYRAENADKLVFKETNTSSDFKRICYFPSYCLTENLFVDCSLNGHATGNHMEFLEYENVHRNLHLKWAKHYASPIRCNQWSKVTLFNPSIELTVSDTNAPVLTLGDYGSSCFVFGGRIFGAGATTGNGVVGIQTSGRSGRAGFIGTQIPKTMNMLFNSTIPDGPWKIEGIGIDAEEGGVVVENWGAADTRSDGYYPTLNAFLPDSVNTPWSWKVYPSNASIKNQFCIPVAKEYTAPAATATITAEVLLADTIATATKGSMWLEITYIDDSTGLPASITTRNFSAGALDSSSASWSATTYGAINLLKKKMSITTPTSIKQNTMVVVTLCGTWKSASALDIMFFCPDVGLS